MLGREGEHGPKYDGCLLVDAVDGTGNRQLTDWIDAWCLVMDGEKFLPVEMDSLATPW